MARTDFSKLTESEKKYMQKKYYPTPIDKLKKLAEKWKNIVLMRTHACSWYLRNVNKALPEYFGSTPEEAIDKAYEAEGME